MAKSEGRRPLRRHRLRWENNMKMGFRGGGWRYGPDLSDSGYGQVAGSCKHGNELSGSLKCGEFLEELRTC